jgi:anti-sigma B factor antagonist
MAANDKNTIEVSKRLDSINVGDFKTEAMAFLEKSEEGIIIDFTNTAFIDSAGLGALVSILKTATQKSKRLALSCLSPQVAQIFELTKLYRIFDIYDTVERAQLNFKS